MAESPPGKRSGCLKKKCQLRRLLLYPLSYGAVRADELTLASLYRLCCENAW